MLINIKKTMTILSTLLLGIMCSFCSDIMIMKYMVRICIKRK